jgi:hypothetical protein
MFTYRRFLLFAVLALMVLVSGCEDRGRNIPTGVVIQNAGGNFPTQHAFSSDVLIDPYDQPQLILQIRNQPALMKMAIYIPQVVFDLNRPVPALILLPPQGGDESYFLARGLKRLLEEMITDGTIQPMIVVSVSNDRTFGGFFYGNSWPAGFYDQVLGVKIQEYLQFNFPTLVANQQKFGIGGLGQGAYGAFRAAIQNPGLYGSITVLDGPLDFDGATGTGGLIPLMDSVFVEQPALTDLNFREPPLDGGFDTSSLWPVSQMFTGGAFAFSPNDTSLTLNIGTDANGNLLISVATREQLADSTALINQLISAGPGSNSLHFHLPFLPSQRPYTPIWQNYWMPNNLDSLHVAAGGSPLAGVNMWIRSSPEAKWGFHEMTQSWYNTLTTNFGYTTVEYSEYIGYDGTPAREGEYLYDQLREMLIFHSESFGD